ncbi:hypothetical protein DCAR_0520087 [Daucus carota subsp. sativus]|uniref:Uncharacterized protein n=1 Tax=Daucus carota subsp. sativus TaxID=79200 RepID=A0A161YL41_DAUCS|nr:hypothetical protein DCAR_0520087 [Daucus carota subsp. sativus]
MKQTPLSQTLFTLIPKFSHLSLTSTSRPSKLIQMGGGPRTFSGGVNKWKWKRMQAKKAEQLLKARLAWERQIYETRKRAELKASADEQVQVLADRFQKPGGLDLWSEKDGPELFKTVDRFPSPRFFLKGVVHSIRPYGRVNEEIDEFGGLGNEKRVQIGSLDRVSDGIDEFGGSGGEKGGVVNVVMGIAPEIGDALLESTQVRKVTFTGSTAVGKNLMAAAAGTVKKVSLELGGNARCIIFDDAELGVAVKGTLETKFRNTGQTCICANTILVQEGHSCVKVDGVAPHKPLDSAILIGLT